MSKPYVHAVSSARKWGGEPEDYLPIHNLMDSSKSAIADSRHRALTHTSWFLWILEQIFGVTLTNSAGRTISVRDVGEQHILEDFGGRFIPSPQDYLENMEVKEWMVAGKGAPPSSSANLPSERPTKTIRAIEFDTPASPKTRTIDDLELEVLPTRPKHDKYLID
jgi:hypothetical protein